MSGGFEANPEAMRAFAAVFADAQRQTEQIKAALEKPAAEQKDFGRSWDDKHGKDFTDAIAGIAGDLANLAKVFTDVQTQLAQTSELVVTGETTHVGTFTQISERTDQVEGR